ncbi:hypothetical protein B0H10DRAFT_2219106 [Mycena sp. CBHHK59/15]|nr:hypothetical protein B0H10DRAFT_2219106 [Mycena sp. CBHHK59/15]
MSSGKKTFDMSVLRALLKTFCLAEESLAFSFSSQRPAAPPLPSTVCTGCGSLVDPTTYVLQYDTWALLAPKALKTGHNHYISGHGKEARDNKNHVRYFLLIFITSARLLTPFAVRWFIKSLASAIYQGDYASAVFASGTADRA